MLTAFTITMVVVFSGEHPTEKLVGLLSEKVGQAESEVIVTVFCDLQPFTKSVVTSV